MSKAIGIEALAVAVPRRFLAIEELAVARGVDPGKYTLGLGAREMAVTDPGEDTVSLAATAGARLLRQHDVDPSRIGMLVVGTETGVDHSKPVASFVQGLLGLPTTMRTFDTQHACYGGTAALMAASDFVAANDDKLAIVIASDVARYGVNTAGEPTQGGGAVAMLVGDGSLLALDRGTSGVYSSNVHDFWRPIGRREAMVDGHYSIECYLEAVRAAYRGWRGRAIAKGLVTASPVPSSQLARIAYHVPFCKMAKKAHAAVRECDLEGVDPDLDASLRTQVSSSLGLPSVIGNTYTASLYFGLAGMLTRESLPTQRIGLFSYGSGCSSEFFSGVVGERASEIIAKADIDSVLAARTKIDVAEYERLMALASDAPEKEAPAPGTFRFTGVAEGRRTYC